MWRPLASDARGPAAAHGDGRAKSGKSESSVQPGCGRVPRGPAALAYLTNLSAWGLRGRTASGSASRCQNAGVRGLGADAANRYIRAHEHGAEASGRPARAAVLGSAIFAGEAHGGRRA